MKDCSVLLLSILRLNAIGINQYFKFISGLGLTNSVCHVRGVLNDVL